MADQSEPEIVPSLQDPELVSRTQIPVIDVVTTAEVVQFEEAIIRNDLSHPLELIPAGSTAHGDGSAQGYLPETLGKTPGETHNNQSPDSVQTENSPVNGTSEEAKVCNSLQTAESTSNSARTLEGGAPPTLAPPTLIRKRSKTMDDFELLKVLGRGAYGKVFLAKHAATGDILAMKVMHKRELVKRKVVTNVKSERLVLESITHPFIVKLRYAFQTEHKLYLLMNYVPGGELFTKLDRDRDMPESHVRFFAAEVALALDYLHSQNIIYRDLKPENVLFTADGHVCLTDFGFARAHVVSNNDSDSFCGTLQYMAPEVIARTGHGKPADWWAFGCLIFEMLTTRTPFNHPNRKQLQDMILKSSPNIPKWLSPEVRHLLKSLLNKNPEERIAFNEIKVHPFFKGINWDKLLRKEIDPPFKPKLKNELDTSNFDARFTAEPVVDTPPPSPETRARQRAERRERREQREKQKAEQAAAAATNTSPLDEALAQGKKKKKGKKQNLEPEPQPSDDSDDETVVVAHDAFDGFSFAGMSPYIPPMDSDDTEFALPTLMMPEASDMAGSGNQGIVRSTMNLGLSPRMNPAAPLTSGVFAMPFPPPHLGTPVLQATSLSVRKNSENALRISPKGDVASQHISNYMLRDGLNRQLSPAASHGPSHSPVAGLSPQNQGLETPRTLTRLHVVSTVPIMSLDSHNHPTSSIHSHVEKAAQSPSKEASPSPTGSAVSSRMVNTAKAQDKSCAPNPSSGEAKDTSRSSQPPKSKENKGRGQEVKTGESKPKNNAQESKAPNSQQHAASDSTDNFTRPTKQQLQRQQQRAEMLRAREQTESTSVPARNSAATAISAGAPRDTKKENVPEAQPAAQAQASTPIPTPPPNSWAGRILAKSAGGPAASSPSTSTGSTITTSSRSQSYNPFNQNVKPPSFPSLSSGSAESKSASAVAPTSAAVTSTTSTVEPATSSSSAPQSQPHPQPRPGTWASKLSVKAPAYMPSTISK